jgi:hypothetical protein
VWLSSHLPLLSLSLSPPGGMRPSSQSLHGKSWRRRLTVRWPAGVHEGGGGGVWREGKERRERLPNIWASVPHQQTHYVIVG